MPSPRVHVGQGFLHRHAVIDGIDVAIYFGIVSIKGSENITYGCIWEVVNKYYEQQRSQKAALGIPEVTGAHCEVAPSITTRWSRPDR